MSEIETEVGELSLEVAVPVVLLGEGVDMEAIEVEAVSELEGEFEAEKLVEEFPGSTA